MTDTPSDQSPDQNDNQDDFDAVSYGKSWLDGVFERMNFDIDVDAKIDQNRLYFDASGADADYLLGIGTSSPKSIEAIQTLLNAALARCGETRDVFLDVRGWRDQHADRLDGVAAELRRVAVKLGKKVTVAGFNTYERSVVHTALEDDASVGTASQGKGAFRKLTVSPK